LLSDQFSGLNGIVVPGTLRDSLVLLALLLEQETELERRRHAGGDNLPWQPRRG
jgi:hypothetical protein